MFISSSNTNNDRVVDNNDKKNDIINRLIFRPPTADEIPTCFEIESSSYPTDEAASLSSLMYRYENASDYFRCAVLSPPNDGEKKANDDSNKIIGFVCATRCDNFENEDAMVTHASDGKLLAIHSVVVEEEYRRRGVASVMIAHYLKTVRLHEEESDDKSDIIPKPIESIVLLAKSHLLGFYVNAGFRVNRASPVVHGRELWYELELPLSPPVRSLPRKEENWYTKTETFCETFPVVKPHLEAHKKWVSDLRSRGFCITSGYRVDSEGRPGGGGLMFLAAGSYEEALEIVLQDPLVRNECVEWELCGWIGQVGDVQMR